jgi:hypothetical protein
MMQGGSLKTAFSMESVPICMELMEILGQAGADETNCLLWITGTQRREGGAKAT